MRLIDSKRAVLAAWTVVILLVLGMATMSSAEFVPDSSKVEHPALSTTVPKDAGELERLKAKLLKPLAAVLAMDEATVLGLIPKDNGFCTMKCPVCGAYVRDGSWSPDDPEHVRCRDCGTIYPSPDYPETQVHRGKNMSGETVEWKYYLNPETGYKCFFSAQVRQGRIWYLLGRLDELGQLYYQTKDEKYARRAAVIMLRFAEAYPHWCVRQDHMEAGHYIVSERPWPPGGVWRNPFNEIPDTLVFAYDLIYDALVWEQLSAELGYDAREKVEWLLRKNFVMARQIWEDNHGWIANLAPYIIRKMIATGLVLNDPDMIHYTIPWMENLIEGRYHFDGMWQEGTVDYHSQHTGHLTRCFNAVRGYTDPPGYVDDEFGIHLEDTDLQEQYPIFTKALALPGKCLYPDGRRMTIHDTHYRSPGKKAKPRPNIELNSYGHFALSREGSHDPTQVHLQFPPLLKFGHYHDDRLSMILWAGGDEVLPDLGYCTWWNTAYYSFAVGKLSHNMSWAGWNEPRSAPEVEYEPGEPDDNWARSSLLAYDPGEHCDKQVQLVEAESPGLPWQEIDVARRLLMLVAIDDERSYVFDLFRLRGGEWHKSVLRPTAWEDCDQQVDLSLAPQSGTLGGEDVEYKQAGAKSLIHNLQVAESSAPQVVTWTGQNTSASVRCFLNGQPETQFIFARAPLIRPSKSALDRDDYQGPWLMRRREGQAGLASSFAAVYDAWAQDQEPMIHSVQWLTPQPSDPFAVAAIVTMKNRTDLVYCSTDNIERAVAGVRMCGRLVVMSRQRGSLAWNYIYEGYIIGAPSTPVVSVPTQPVPLVGVVREPADERYALDVAARLPRGGVLRGVWLRVVQGDGSAYGYRIQSVEKIAGGSRIIIHDDPGFEMTDEGMHMLFFPNYTIPGQQQVEISVPGFVRAR